MDAAEAGHFNPALVYVDADNRITHSSHGHLAAV
jgi:aspartate 1-decarboxylase